jgi:hypothetical protein
MTMTRQDTATRRVTTGIVLAVGLFAGGDSYAHIYALARGHGQGIVSAALLPLAGDGVIAAASAVMLVASRQGRDIPLGARVLLLAGIAATAAANVAYGLPAGLTGALLSIWPVVAYVGCMELLAWMRANTQPKPTRAASVSTPADASVSADAPDDELKDRRQRKSRQPVAELLRAAGQAFPEAKAGNIPTLRTIQRQMGIGQAKAQQVQHAIKSGRVASAGAFSG